MRGNLTIDYEQIGLKFRLYSCEIFFNKGLSQIYTVRPSLAPVCRTPPRTLTLRLRSQGNSTDGFRNLQRASTEKQTAEHSVIDEAIRDEGEVSRHSHIPPSPSDAEIDFPPPHYRDTPSSRYP